MEFFEKISKIEKIILDTKTSKDWETNENFIMQRPKS
jgi:hypothetical protein